MDIKSGSTEEREPAQENVGQGTELEEVRRVQELSPTILVARIRELLPVIYNTLSQHEYHRSVLRLSNAIRDLDALMTNGAGMPDQWALNEIPDLDIDTI